MKKKIISLLLVLALCLGMTFSVSAEDAEGFANDYCRVQDMAGLMTDSEEAKLNDILDELSIRQKMDVVVVTTNTLDEKTVQEYADDIYDYGNFGYGQDKDGILLLISLGEENDCYISTCGYGITAFTDAGIKYISKEMTSDLKNGNYFSAFQTFSELCDEFITQQEYPVSLQLFGSDPKIISEQAKRIEDLPFQILDINMGCPVPKVVKNGEGSALMKNPKLVFEIVSQLVKAIEKPVTVKIRKGFDDDHINAVEIAKIAEEAGASAVAIHGRTREQYYSGEADWDIIRQVKEAVHIPVIGNGDVTSAEKAAEMRKITGCDGVMIGRGVQGNPWIFRELAEYDRTGTIPPRPTQEEIRNMMLRHARMQLEFKGEYLGIREMRKHVAWYVKGMKGAAKFRAQINQVESYEELEELLKMLIK